MKLFTKLLCPISSQSSNVLTLHLKTRRVNDIAHDSGVARI